MSTRDRNSTPQRVLVTGARGKVGAATVAALAGAGHEVIATDLGRPTYDADGSNVRYVQADLTQPGDAFAIVRDVDAVVHAAGIPEPTRNVAHTVFLTNVAATFAVLEAATANRVPRVVNLSSDSVTGMTWAHAPFEGLRCPIDETHPELAHDAYGLSKRVGEMLCEAFVTRTGGSAVSVRPTWVLTADTYASNLDGLLRAAVERAAADPTSFAAGTTTTVEDTKDKAHVGISAWASTFVAMAAVLGAAFVQNRR